MVACLTGLFCHPSEHAEPIDIHFIKNTKGGNDYGINATRIGPTQNANSC